jgi:hypothetical protein
MAAIKSESALTPNVGPFGRIPQTRLLARVAGFLDAASWYAMPRVSKAFANPKAAEKLRARNIQVVASWGSFYVDTPQWFNAGGWAQANQRNKYGGHEDPNSPLGRLLALWGREEDEVRRAKAVADPEPNSLVARYLQTAYSDRSWIWGRSANGYSLPTLNQVQFVQLVRRLRPGQCGRLQHLDLCIPRPDRGSRSKGIPPQANLIEAEDLRRLARACPNLQTFVLRDATPEELQTFLSLERDPLSDPEERQFPGALSTLVLHGTDLPEAISPLLAKMSSLRSVKIFSNRVYSGPAARLAQTFSKVSLLDTLGFNGGNINSTCAQSIASIQSISSLQMLGSTFETWEAFERVAAMPHLRAVEWGNMSLPRIYTNDWSDICARSQKVMDILVRQAGCLEQLHIRWERTELDASLPRCAGMRSLKYLLIEESPFTDVGLAALGRCSQLSELRLRWPMNESSYYKLTDDGLMALKSCPLTALSLSGRHFTTQGVCRFVEVAPSLKTLNLRRTPHLNCAQITAVADKLGKKLNIMGSPYEQLFEVLSAFEQQHPDAMKRFLLLPEVERQGAYRGDLRIQRLPGAAELIDQHGEQQFWKLAFENDARLKTDYHLTHSVQLNNITFCLRDLLDKIQ